MTTPCPSNPPPPDGTDVWKGSVPPALSTWAASLIPLMSKVPYGTTYQYDEGGVVATARKDYHTWHYQADGTLLTGICWFGATLYRPLPVGGPPGSTNGDIFNIETATPDPTIAVYDPVYVPGDSALPPPSETSWPLVGVCLLAAGATVALVVGAIQTAGR